MMHSFFKMQQFVIERYAKIPQFRAESSNLFECYV